jgi:cathepsin F
MKMKILTILLISYGLSFNIKNFDHFTDKFDKDYSSTEKVMASFWFKQNNNLLEDLKSMELDFKVGITKFHDMAPQQFKKKLLTFKPDSEDLLIADPTNTQSSFIEISSSSTNSAVYLPSNFDWRDKGALTPIKDQKTCGGCWAFSTAANIESQYLMKYGKVVDLSEQNFINCISKNLGCNGGNMKNAMTYIQGAGGVVLESSQPYKNSRSSCSTSGMTGSIKVASYNKLKSTNEDEIALFLYQNGPLSAALNADKLQFYMGGIFDIPDCDASQPNHAINIVGYGVENGKPYWIIRNSWGTDWGENGYFRVARGKNMCGISSYVITALVQ